MCTMKTEIYMYNNVNVHCNYVHQRFDGEYYLCMRLCTVLKRKAAKQTTCQNLRRNVNTTQHHTHIDEMSNLSLYSIRLSIHMKPTHTLTNTLPFGKHSVWFDVRSQESTTRNTHTETNHISSQSTEIIMRINYGIESFESTWNYCCQLKFHAEIASR